MTTKTDLHFSCATCAHWAGIPTNSHAKCRKHGHTTFATDGCTEYLGNAHSPTGFRSVITHVFTKTDAPLEEEK